MKINEIFESIQGEGKYLGHPCLFIRLSGCNRKCSFCDSKYHITFFNIETDELIKKINSNKHTHIVWTGGEPLLQWEEIQTVIEKTIKYFHTLETNGDLLLEKHISSFDYISCSPKNVQTAKRIKKFMMVRDDIKVVTDLKLNLNILKYATMLMPLTTSNNKDNKLISQHIWQYCLDNKIKFAPRTHIDVWGRNMRGK